MPANEPKSTDTVALPPEPVSDMLAATLAFWTWPLFQHVLLEVIAANGYDLKLGGWLLNVFASALSLVVALVMSLCLYLKMRRGRGTAGFTRVVPVLACSLLAASTVVLGYFFAMGMFCEIGACSSSH